jgi:hypothetical protein
LKFDLEQDEEKKTIPATEDFSEDEEVIPAAKCEVEISLKVIEGESESCGEGLPDDELVYVEFLRKSGDSMLFGKFLREFSQKCDMFKED